MKFFGQLSELQSKLFSLKGGWTQLGPSVWQFRTPAGGVLNWFSSTGSLQFQGTVPGKAELEQSLASAIGNVIPPKGTQTKGGITSVIQAAPSQRTPTPIKVLDRAMPPVSSPESELVIALVGAVGTDLHTVEKLLTERLGNFNYRVLTVRVSNDLIKPKSDPDTIDDSSPFNRIWTYIDAGDRLRESSGQNDVLALGCAETIGRSRKNRRADDKPEGRTAYIINSLKHPDEVAKLRQIYSSGFFLVGAFSDQQRRQNHLVSRLGMSGEEAGKLIDRDADEKLAWGQHTADTFHLSDVFVNVGNNTDALDADIERLLKILFGFPYATPTFDEYAMFLSFAASLRSGDLSRQVGAVVARRRDIIATGANDVPKFGGGLYWFDDERGDPEHAGRDYRRRYDSNKAERQQIIESILANLGDLPLDREVIRRAVDRSKLQDITEYGRAVHAEMEAIISAARNGISLTGADLYCTTFPCHNCAKHIVAAGISRVVYVEPYPKSKALDLHDDSIVQAPPPQGEQGPADKVRFEPFVGVGPRRFFDLFSMNLGSGYRMVRHNNGVTVEWNQKGAQLRTQLQPQSYLQREGDAAEEFTAITSRLVPGA